MFVIAMLIIISLQIVFLTAGCIIYVLWKRNRANRRDRALAENLRLSLKRRYEMESLRLQTKK